MSIYILDSKWTTQPIVIEAESYAQAENLIKIRNPLLPVEEIKYITSEMLRKRND